MAETGSDYQHGDQDAGAHAAAYRLFGSLTKWVALHLAVVILVLTLWFCTGAGFVAGLIAGAVVLGLGIWFLRSPRREQH